MSILCYNTKSVGYSFLAESDMEAKYKRVLLKVSGEAISKGGYGIDPEGLAKVAE